MFTVTETNFLYVYQNVQIFIDFPPDSAPTLDLNFKVEQRRNMSS